MNEAILSKKFFTFQNAKRFYILQQWTPLDYFGFDICLFERYNKFGQKIVQNQKIQKPVVDFGYQFVTKQ